MEVGLGRRLAGVLLVALLASCGPSSASTPPSGASVEPTGAVASASLGLTGGTPAGTFSLPFPAGTIAQIGPFGLHDSNFRSMPGGFTLAGAGTVGDASIDLLAPAGTPVLPVAAGTVLAVWPTCQVVLVDHSDGTWVEYVHLSVEVAPGDPVTTSKEMGKVCPCPAPGATADPQCGALESTAPHLHIAFLSASGVQGQYVSMNGRTLCGHLVDAAGDIGGLATVGGPTFPIPACGQSQQAPPSLTPSTPPASAAYAGLFRQTGTIAVDRYGHTATLLQDGRVLVAGGVNENAVLASAELYDPTTGTFSPTGDMTVPRVGHTATLLLDGRVLIAGGANDANGTLNKPVYSAEIYDP